MGERQDSRRRSLFQSPSSTETSFFLLLTHDSAFRNLSQNHRRFCVSDGDAVGSTATNPEGSARREIGVVEWRKRVEAGSGTA